MSTVTAPSVNGHAAPRPFPAVTRDRIASHVNECRADIRRASRAYRKALRKAAELRAKALEEHEILAEYVGRPEVAAALGADDAARVGRKTYLSTTRCEDLHHEIITPDGGPSEVVADAPRPEPVPVPGPEDLDLVLPSHAYHDMAGELMCHAVEVLALARTHNARMEKMNDRHAAALKAHPHGAHDDFAETWRADMVGNAAWLAFHTAERHLCKVVLLLSGQARSVADLGNLRFIWRPCSVLWDGTTYAVRPHPDDDSECDIDRAVLTIVDGDLMRSPGDWN